MYLIQLVVMLIMANPFFPRFPFSPYHRYPTLYFPNPSSSSSSFHAAPASSTQHMIKQIDPPESKTEKKDPFFEIFGLKLFFDDILLMCLIFFLYSEGVKDEMLFLALILLLLS